MSHAILDGYAVCNEPEDALCRAEWQCDCETFDGIEQDAEGWTHEAWSGWLDALVLHHSVGVLDARHCNIVSWLNADMLQDTFADYDYLYNNDDLPNGDIKVSWEGDFYQWEYADPRVTGRMIGRSVVAAWADNLGLDADPIPPAATFVAALQKVDEAAKRLSAALGGGTAR